MAVLVSFQSDVESIVEYVGFGHQVGYSLDPLPCIIEGLLKLEEKVNVLVLVKS